MLPRFAYWWVGLYAALSLILYVPALDPLEGTSYSPLAAILAALALAGYAVGGARAQTQLAKLRPASLRPDEEGTEPRQAAA